MPARSTKPPRPELPAPDFRRSISRQTWLSNRARNALQRPAFIGAISVGTLVTAIVSMVVVPRTQEQTATPVLSAPRPDTLTAAANAALARARLAEAESALVVARTDLAAAEAYAARARAADTIFRPSIAARDSIQGRTELIDALILRTEQAPLPSSYRALAALPEIGSDARIRALLDSLSDIERERESFGAVGGVDPIFVALTSRANEVGRAIRAIADEKRQRLRTELASMQPVAPVAETLPTIDTLSRVAARDSISGVLEIASTELARLRAVTHALDREEAQARELASAVAPPLALLAAAFVLSGIVGFAIALFAELRRPRVSDANELERFAGVRVLSNVEPTMPNVERGRREFDRAAPPYFDPGAQGYQLAYLSLATEHPGQLVVTVTGDDPAIAAVVACNLAAVAADEARHALVVDFQDTCGASAALRSRVSPGIADILQGNATWPDATIACRVGRDKSVDLVPRGLASSAETAADFVALIEQDAIRLARYYDAIFVLAEPDDVAAGLPAALPLNDVVYCAQPGLTPLRRLRARLEEFRAAGAITRGVVLWNATRPLLPTPRELAARPRPKAMERHAASVASR